LDIVIVGKDGILHGTFRAMDGNASSRYGEEKSANASKESVNPRLFGICIRAVALLRRIGCGRAHFGPGDPFSREANLPS
jgi:hypothetical protein